MKNSLWMLVWSLLCVAPVIAQGVCSEIVDSALVTLAEVCSANGLNQVCYGNPQVAIAPLDDTALSWESPGDTASIFAVESIEVSAMQEPDIWGLAQMNIQANLPDTIPGQSVTFVLLGAVRIDNAEAFTLSATTTGNVNIRSGASTSKSVAGSLAVNTVVDLIGRNTASDWVYFISDNTQGWLFASLLTIDGDVSLLEVVPDDFSGQLYQPMQAIYLETGVGDSQCVEAPGSGILVQTPEYAATIDLLINGVRIELGSTIFVQAEADHAMWISVLEGQAIVTAQDETVIVPEGAVVSVAMDANLSPTAPPAVPQAYSREDLASLPLTSLTVPITAAEPADDATLEFAAAETAAYGTGFTGVWYNIDGDGSRQTLTFTRIADGSYRVRYIDAGASICHPNRQPIYAITGVGIGTQQGDTVSVNLDFTCHNPENTPLNFTITFTLNRSSNTLSDDVGAWYRNP